jgi:hypothetical protein
LDPIGHVGVALGKALLGPIAKSAGQRLGEVAFGPRHEAALQKVYERTVDMAIGSCLPADAPREHREHVRWVVEQSIAAHGWDLGGARAAGFRTAYIERPQEYGPNKGAEDPARVECDIVVRGFDELADVLGCPRPSGTGSSGRAATA